jgi:hypothetical protein
MIRYLKDYFRYIRSNEVLFVSFVFERLFFRLLFFTLLRIGTNVKRFVVNRKIVRMIIFGISMGMLIFLRELSDKRKQAY